MTPEEVPDLFRAMESRLSTSAPDIAMSMAQAYGKHVRNDTLRRFAHAPGTRTNSPPGQPPAMITGELAASVRSWRGPGSGLVGRAYTGANTVYARIQEYGGDIYPRRRKYLHWVTGGKSYYKEHVHLPERPYMRPALVETYRDGTLSRAAIGAFARKMGRW